MRGISILDIFLFCWVIVLTKFALNYEPAVVTFWIPLTLGFYILYMRYMERLGNEPLGSNIEVPVATRKEFTGHFTEFKLQEMDLDILDGVPKMLSIVTNYIMSPVTSTATSDDFKASVTTTATSDDFKASATSPATSDDFVDESATSPATADDFNASTSSTKTADGFNASDIYNMTSDDFVKESARYTATADGFNASVTSTATADGFNAIVISMATSDGFNASATSTMYVDSVNSNFTSMTTDGSVKPNTPSTTTANRFVKPSTPSMSTANGSVKPSATSQVTRYVIHEAAVSKCSDDEFFNEKMNEIQDIISIDEDIADVSCCDKINKPIIARKDTNFAKIHTDSTSDNSTSTVQEEYKLHDVTHDTKQKLSMDNIPLEFIYPCLPNKYLF